MADDFNDINLIIIELFAEATDRIDAGEPVDQVLDSYPADVQSELRALVESATQTEELLATSPVPPMSLKGRDASRSAFLSQIAQDQAEIALASAVVGESSPLHSEAAPQPSVESRDVRRASSWSAPQESWIQRLLRPLSGLGRMHLAPITALLLITLLVGIPMSVVAQNSIPGDLTYPIKDWVRDVRIQLAPEIQQEKLREDLQERRVQDVKTAATQAQQEGESRRATGKFLFQEELEDGSFVVGDTERLVLSNHAPGDETNPEARQTTMVSGDLVPGSLVEVEYALLPAMDGSGEPIKQALSITVVATPTPVPPTVTPAVAQSPTPMPTVAPTACFPYQPSGWASYRIQPGDTLSALAARSGTSVGQLMTVNCLGSSTIVSGARLYGPASLIQPTATATPPPMLTITPSSTLPATATAASPITTTVSVTATVLAQTPTIAPGVTLTITPTQAATAIPTASATSSPPPATVLPTSAVTFTPQPTAYPPPVQTATATASVAPPSPTLVPSPSASPSPTGMTPTAMPSLEPTLEPTPTATSVSTIPVTATPTSIPSVAPQRTVVIPTPSFASPTHTSTPAPAP